MHHHPQWEHPDNQGAGWEGGERKGKGGKVEEGGKGKKGSMGMVGNVGNVGMSNVGGASSLRAASAGCICIDTSRKAHRRIIMYLE